MALLLYRTIKGSFMRIAIMLDFDGVILTNRSYEGFGHDTKTWDGIADQECVDQLNRITDTTGCDIVVSSSWRGPGLQNMIDQLGRWGVTGRVVGTTPFLPRGRSIRGREIEAYLAENPYDRFVILDDDNDMGKLRPYLIRTTMDKGLTQRKASNAIKRLKGEWKC